MFGVWGREAHASRGIHVWAPSFDFRLLEVENNHQLSGVVAGSSPQLAGMIVTVRAVAFERAGDARVYLEAFQLLGIKDGQMDCCKRHGIIRNHIFQLPLDIATLRSGCPAPLPRGHVCCRSTPPATTSSRGLTWNCSLEFRAGGAEAAQQAMEEAQSRHDGKGGQEGIDRWNSKFQVSFMSLWPAYYGY